MPAIKLHRIFINFVQIVRSRGGDPTVIAPNSLPDLLRFPSLRQTIKVEPGTTEKPVIPTPAPDKTVSLGLCLPATVN